MQLPPPAHDPEAVRDLADRILAQSRYDRPSPSIPQRILDWFLEQLGKVLGSVVGSGTGTLIAWAVVLGAVAGAVYLVVRHGRVARLPGLPERPPSTMVELRRTPAEWRREAASLEAAGRWREALRCRYRALIGDLVHRGTIPDQAGRTAGEYRRDVAGSAPAAAAAMGAATDLFEGAWYGHAPTGPDEARRFEELVREVLQHHSAGSDRRALAGRR